MRLYHRIIVIGIIVLIFASGFILFSNSPFRNVEAAAPSSYLTGFGYYKEITVTNKLDDYQSKIIVGKSSGGDVTTENHCQDDFDDIRFAYSNGTLLNYHKYNYTSGTQATFKLKNHCNASTIYLYYGNASVSTTSDPSNTYIFYDDASTNRSSEYTSVDIRAAGNLGIITYDAVNYYYTLSAYGDNTMARIDDVGSMTNVRIEAQVYRQSATANNQGGVIARQSAINEYLCSRYIHHSTTKILSIYQNDGGSESDLDTYTYTIPGTIWHKVDMTVAGSTLTAYWYNVSSGALLDTLTGTTTVTGEGYVGIFGGYAATSYVRWKNVMVSMYAATEPSFSFGSESTTISVEVSPATYTIVETCAAGTGKATWENFTLYNNWTAKVKVKITVNDSANWVFKNFTDWKNPTSSGWFAMNYTLDNITWYEIKNNAVPTTYLKNFTATGSETFGLKIWIPKYLPASSAQTITLWVKGEV